MIVLPLPFMVPLVQVDAPLNVAVPLPEIVPPDCANPPLIVAVPLMTSCPIDIPSFTDPLVVPSRVVVPLKTETVPAPGNVGFENECVPPFSIAAPEATLKTGLECVPPVFSARMPACTSTVPLLLNATVVLLKLKLAVPAPSFVKIAPTLLLNALIPVLP